MLLHVTILTNQAAVVQRVDNNIRWMNHYPVICQQASRAKTRGWRGGSIIKPCESTVQAEKISSDREKCWQGNIPVVR